MKKYIIISLLLLLFSSCIKFVHVVDIDLGDGYKVISSPDYYELIITKGDGLIIVWECVLDYNTDSTFIVVAQRPKDDTLYVKYKHEEIDEVLENSVFYQCWIVNKQNDSIYGPYQKEQYLQKKMELGVCDTLQLKVEKYNGYIYKYKSPRFTLFEKIKEQITE